MTNSKWCLSPHYSGHQVVFLFSRAEKGQREVIFISILEMLTLWAWGDYNYKLSQKTWSLTSWWFSSCPWHFAGIAISSTHQSMAVGSVWGAIINILHDDRFASGVATGQDQHHLPRFHELAHLGSYHSGLQQKARKGTSANLSPQEAWSHFPVVFKH